MKTKIIIAASIVWFLVGCSKPTAPTTPRVRTSQRPTATEVFNLRGRCQQLGEKLDSNMPYGGNWSRQTTTNYSVEANRCYVELYDMKDTGREHLRSLYDGQTSDLLAYARKDRATVGMIFIDSNIDTASDCKDGGDCGYTKVNDFISEKMKRDDAETRAKEPEQGRTQ
jgi:hypothetical protein